MVAVTVLCSNPFVCVSKWPLWITFVKNRLFVKNLYIFGFFNKFLKAKYAFSKNSLHVSSIFLPKWRKISSSTKNLFCSYKQLQRLSTNFYNPCQSVIIEIKYHSLLILIVICNLLGSRYYSVFTLLANKNWFSIQLESMSTIVIQKLVLDWVINIFLNHFSNIYIYVSTNVLGRGRPFFWHSNDHDQAKAMTSANSTILVVKTSVGVTAFKIPPTNLVDELERNIWTSGLVGLQNVAH